MSLACVWVYEEEFETAAPTAICAAQTLAPNDVKSTKWLHFIQRVEAELRHPSLYIYSPWYKCSTAGFFLDGKLLIISLFANAIS